MIKTGSIFHVEYNNYYGTQKRHYFYCIYTQKEDINNTLSEDVIGLMITTNEKMDYIVKYKNDYNVKIKLNDKTAYVCCDKIFRFNVKDKKVDYVGDLLNAKEKKAITKYYKRFIKESLRQLQGVNNENK
jgi:hypothetical protein